MDRGAWQATDHGVAKNRPQWRGQHFRFQSIVGISPFSFLSPSGEQLYCFQ